MSHRAISITSVCRAPLVLLLFSLLAPRSTFAQAALPIYTDHLVNGFQDWSWATHNLANASPVHSGTASISQMYLDPSEFVAGTTYQVEVEFDNIVAGPTALGGTLGSAMAVSTYNARTTFDLAVIPEPSAYAVLAGVAVLAMAAMRRRARRQAW